MPLHIIPMIWNKDDLQLRATWREKLNTAQLSTDMKHRAYVSLVNW
jgi:hypothetical protein